MFDPAKKAENKASFEAMNAKLGVQPEEEEVWVRNEISRESSDKSINEAALEAENTAEEQDQLLEDSADYLIDNGMMSESGRLLVDAQAIYDIQLDGKPWVNARQLQDIRQKAQSRNAPVKRDLYGQAGQQKAA